MTYTISTCIFFFNDTATTEIYTLSLHDALPISPADVPLQELNNLFALRIGLRLEQADAAHQDRKSTRLNSSHSQISYAVFCLKKKKITTNNIHRLQSTSKPSQIS